LSVLHRSFRVHSYEVDPGGHLAPRALCAYLQEVAGEDATRAGVSMARLGEVGLAWVLHRVRLEVARHPRAGETVTVYTWPSRFEYALAWRDFEVQDEHGARVAAATSRWVVVDLAARRLTRLPDFVRSVPVADRPAALGELRALPAPNGVDVERRFEVRRGDLDMLRHVNNTRYVEWVLETAPPDVVDALRPAVVDVEFRREALFGDVVVSRSRRIEADGITFAHELRSASSGLELSRASSRWAG
jgi:medium-chain acyl-[acyl-carrier-protein] hydrolase